MNVILFVVIVSLGLAIPSTLVLGINIIVKLLSGDDYVLSLGKVFIVYLIALVSWAIFFSLR